MMPAIARNRVANAARRAPGDVRDAIRGPDNKNPSKTRDAHRERPYAGFLTRPARCIRTYHEAPIRLARPGVMPFGVSPNFDGCLSEVRLWAKDRAAALNLPVIEIPGNQ